MITITSFVNM